MIDLRDMILQIPNLVPEEKSKTWIKFFEDNVDKTVTEKSTKYLGGSQSIVTTDNYRALNLTENMDKSDFKDIANDIFQYISASIYSYESYLKTKITKAITRQHMTDSDHIRIMRYEEGQSIGDHLDIGREMYRASCTLNLNDDYEGGEFSFFSGKHLIDLKAGEGMMFPAEQVWIHGVKPITKGTRYCVNCFLRPKK